MPSWQQMIADLVEFCQANLSFSHKQRHVILSSCSMMCLAKVILLFCYVSDTAWSRVTGWLLLTESGAYMIIRTDIIKIHILLNQATTSVTRSLSCDIFSLIKLIKHLLNGLIHLPSYHKSPPSTSCSTRILSCPRTVMHLVTLHILVCHLVSPAWHCMGPPILSYSYSTSILFPLLLYSGPALLHFFIYFYRRGRLASCTPLLIGASSSCPIKYNLEAPSRAIRAASLPTSCNEAQHILESIAPLVSPNGTSLLSKKQCKWKWTYSLASRREKPLPLSACNSLFQIHTHTHSNTHTTEPPPCSSSGLLLQLALFLWYHVLFVCAYACTEDNVHVLLKVRWEWSECG